MAIGHHQGDIAIKVRHILDGKGLSWMGVRGKALEAGWTQIITLVAPLIEAAALAVPTIQSKVAYRHPARIAREFVRIVLPLFFLWEVRVAGGRWGNHCWRQV